MTGTLTELLSSPGVERLGWTLIHFLWQGAGLAILLATALRLTRRRSAGLRYLLSCAALAAMAAAPVVTFVNLERLSRLDPRLDQNTAQSSGESLGNSSLADLDDGGAPMSESARDPVASLEGEPQQAAGRSGGPANEPLRVSDMRPASVQPPAPGRFVEVLGDVNPYTPWIVFLWAAGVCGLAARHFGGWILLRRLKCRAAGPVSHALQGLLDDLLRRMRMTRRVRLIESAKTAIPLVAGCWRPVLLLPVGALSGLTARELEAILAHELAHIRRHDYLVNVVQTVVETLLFYHPAVWWVSSRIRVEREFCADDLAVAACGDRELYARALASLAELARAVPRPALAATDGPLLRRVRRVLGTPATAATSARPRTYLATAFAAVALISGLWLLVVPQETSTRAAEPSEHSQAVPSASSAGTLKPITGSVLAPGGRPVAGASVYLRERPYATRGGTGHPVPTANLAVTTTDARGRFRFENVAAPPEIIEKQATGFDVIATADGFGVAWKHRLLPKPVHLKLAKEARITGRLLDPDGKPIAGAKVRAIQLTWFEAPARRTAGGPGPRLSSPSFLELESSQISLADVTDAEGRFAIGGLPENIRVMLLVDDERYLRRELFAATTTEPQRKLEDGEPVHTGDFTETLTPGHSLRVRIVGEDTGKPIAGSGLSGRRIIHPPQFRANADGVHVYRQLPPGEFRFWVYPPDRSPYLSVIETAEMRKEQREIERTVKLPNGAIVSGRVVDAKTGEGIGGAKLSHMRPAAAPPGSRRTGFFNRQETDPDGRFRGAVPPGKGDLVVFGHVPGYITHQRSGSLREVDQKFRREIEATLDKPLDGIEFRLEPAPVISGRTVDPDGKPVANVRIRTKEDLGGGLSRTHEWSLDESGRFLLDGLFTSSTSTVDSYHLVFSNPKRRLGTKLHVLRPKPDESSEPLVVRLEPMGTVSGRVVDESRRPIPGAALRLTQWWPHEGDLPRRGRTIGDPVITDRGGRFSFGIMVPGLKYSLRAGAKGYAAPDRAGFFEVAAGESTQQEVELVKADQSIAGVIVDSVGNPFPGVRIYGRFGNDKATVRTPTVTTDSEGRFRLKGLPKGQGHWSARIPGLSKQFHATKPVPVGKQDLRIQLDWPEIPMD